MTTYSPHIEQFQVERDSDRAMDRAHTPRQQEGSAALTPRWERLTDDSLIAHCKAGYRPAWDALLNRYRGYIFRYAWYLCRNGADADDITARTLARIYVSLHTFRSESSFTAWITRIAYNLFLDTVMRSRHSHTLSLDNEPLYEDLSICGHDLADPNPTPEEHYVDEAAVEHIARVIQHLPAYLRRSLQLRLQGYSYEQTAATLGISVGTVKSRISRARCMLHERLNS